MDDEGRHWSDPDCAICSWFPALDLGDGQITDQLCQRCRVYDGASTAERVREPESFYLAQAEACEKLARLGAAKEVAPFSRLMWERTALHWRLAAIRGYRWIPNTGAEVVFMFRRTPQRFVPHSGTFEPPPTQE